MVFVREYGKADLTSAWRFAILSQSTKIPKRPEELWGEEEKRRVVSVEDMMSMLTANNPKNKRKV